MMKKLLLLILAIFTLACSSDDDSTNFLYQNYNRSIGSSVSCGILQKTCPVGVDCDDNSIPSAYVYSDENFNIRINFDTGINESFSVEDIRNNLNYTNFLIRFNENSNEDVKYTYSNREPIRSLNQDNGEGAYFRINSYEGGVLNATISGHTNEITKSTISDDPDCFIGDMGGICAERIDADIEYNIDLNLCFES